MAGEYQIPFSKSGDQQHYPDDWYGGVVWKDNEVFEDSLVYEGYSRGRSAAYFDFTRKGTGTRVTVFLKDFEAMVPKMVRGSISSRFTFTKRGQNYGCKLA